MLCLYDKVKLEEAREALKVVYEYNYKSSSPFSAKLSTVIRKLDKLIEEYTEDKSR